MRKGIGHPTSKADGSGQVSSLTGTPQCTDHIWDLPLPLMAYTRGSYLNLILWVLFFTGFTRGIIFSKQNLSLIIEKNMVKVSPF